MIQTHHGHAKARPYFFTNTKLSPDSNNRKQEIQEVQIINQKGNRTTLTI